MKVLRSDKRRNTIEVELDDLSEIGYLYNMGGFENMPNVSQYRVFTDNFQQDLEYLVGVLNEETL